jgi:hypothetical protein
MDDCGNTRGVAGNLKPREPRYAATAFNFLLNFNNIITFTYFHGHFGIRLDLL